MSDELNPKANPDQPMIYHIRIKGHLGFEWADWFSGMTIKHETCGDTLLYGTVTDQSALHGLLKRIRDIGAVLISVTYVESN